MSSVKDYRLGLLLSVGAAFAWSTAGFFTRLIEHDSYTILFWRGIFGAIGIFAMILIRHRGGWKKEMARFGRLEVIYMLLTASGMSMFIISLNMTTIAHNSVIYATIPFVSALLGWFILKEVPSRTAIFASLVALAGVVLMMSTGQDGDIWGDILSFGMTLTMACSIILVRRHPQLATMPAVIAGALLGSLVCGPFGHPLDVTWLDLVYLACFGVVSSALGNLLFALGSSRIPVIETALIGALDTPLAPFWVFLAFHKVPGPNSIIGGLIVSGAVVTHIILSHRTIPATPLAA